MLQQSHKTMFLHIST